MTVESRRKITGQILSNKENSQASDDYKNSMEQITSRIKSDKVNRDEFIIVNSKIIAYKTELENSAGLFTSNLGLPLSTITYYQDNNYTMQETDSVALWDGATLKIGNIFYIPTVENSEKLIMDSIREKDTDDTTNVEPIIPPTLSSFFQSPIPRYNEKTTLDLLLWAKAAFFNGYSSYSGTEQVESSAFADTLEVVSPGNFTIGNYLHFHSGANYFIGIVTNKVQGFDGDPGTITVMLNTTNTYSGTIFFTEKIVAGSQTAKDILLHLANYWKGLVLAQRNNLQAIPSTEISSIDSDQIAVLQAVLDHINNWFLLSDAEKFTAGNLNALLSIQPQRVSNINSRVAYLNTGALLNDLLIARNEVIKVRLKKRGGTLNTVYREILAAKSSLDKKETENKSFEYYKNKFIVKRIIDGCSDSKIIYAEESSGLSANDAVYIICDDEQTKEVKTFIKDIVNYQKPSNKELALEPNYIQVKKITIANNISSSFSESQNARIAKQLSE